MMFKRYNQVLVFLSLCIGAVFVPPPAFGQISITTWGQGGVRIGDSTTTCDAAAEGSVRYNDTSNIHQFCNGTAWANIGTGAPLSGLSAATATNTINNVDFTQTWNWNSLTSGTALSMGSSSQTTGSVLLLTGSNNNAASTGSVVRVDVTGTSNAAVPLTLVNAGTGASFRVNDDGTTTDSSPFFINAAGSVAIGNISPAAKLHVSGTAIIGNGGESCSGTTAGGLRYNSGALQLCDGTSWTSIGGTCSDITPAAFAFTDQINQTASTVISSNILQITGINCAVNVTISGGGSPEYQVCSDNTCTTVVTSWTSSMATISSGQYLQLRLTSNATGGNSNTATVTVGLGSDAWSVGTIADCTGSPPAGAICADGTVYAGLTPDGNVPMYTTRCSAGQTWSGTACTGTLFSYTWNNGNNTGTTVTSATSSTAGETNTTTIVGVDSDSINGGTQDHQAAKYCNDLTQEGYSDWYLPAASELLVMCANYLSFSSFVGTHASSTESSTTAFTSVTVNGCSQNGGSTKWGGYNFRCVRK